MLTFRNLSYLVCLAVANLSVPFGGLLIGHPIVESIEKALQPKPAPYKAKSGLLTYKEQSTIKGQVGQCPYIAGQNKWDVMYRGIDLMSGNYSASVTDLSFDGGYGIPVNVTRAYSSNSGDESPFGYGWSLSADVRSTAGGLLTGPAAPIRSVPVNFQERPPKESDPNVATQPVAAVTSTSSSGKQETIQKDVDGVLTTPPWDNNVSNPSYQEVTLNGSQYQVQSGNQTTTLDGTVYTYSFEGSYPNGNLPYNASQISPAPTPTPSNVLKVTQATDRQGNVTNYVYNQSTWVTFNKMDGQTQEHPLSSVNMPNGHTITFTWGNGSNAPTNRIVSISDGTRTVAYTYTNGNLTGVTTPGGKTTLYGYGSATDPQGWTGDTATNLLTSMTSPQGLTTSVVYQMAYVNVAPYQVSPGEGVEVHSETMPNGCYVGVSYQTNSGVTVNNFAEYDSSNTMWNHGALYGYQSGGQFTVEMENTGSVWVNDILGQHGLYWEKSYDPNSENLLQEVDNIVIPYSGGPAAAAEHYLRGYGPNQSQTLTTTTAYNFAGNPLSKTVVEATTAMPGYTAPANHTTTMSYAYWGPAEYYQQLGTEDAGGRYTYTSYYPNTAAAGSRGQKYQVFDQAHAGFYLNTNITPPSYAQQADYWKYQLTPTAGDYTAQFDYDSVGRCTTVYQLHSTTTNPWTYVQTQTTYGSNTDGSWGQAKEVVEDVGGIGRTTQTLQYTAWGKADQVLDAAGHQFNTVFDLDGNIQSVTRVDSGLNEAIATYVYGPTPGTVSYGQPTSITDGLTGVSDSISYQASGGGIGEPSGTSETNGSSTYSVAYTYDLAGNRAQTTYTTPNGTELWGYFDYVPIGSPEGLHRAFQTLNKLTSGGSRSSEEMHYAFDSGGRLYCAAFAQTPQSGQTGYQTEAAASRCRTDYIYDPSGRVLGVENYWDTYNGSGFNVEAVLANDCQYEYTNLNRGLKTSSSFYKNTAEGSSSWTLDHTESYSYDPSLDFLTGANYGDGLPNQTPSWSYDAAQNRTDSVVDNLNRTTSIGGVTTTCDILGNRLTEGAASHFPLEV